MRQTPVNDYLEDISTELPEEIYGCLSDAIYETVCEFDEEVTQLKDENDKLRELVQNLRRVIPADVVGVVIDANTDHPTYYKFDEVFRELGIEVDA